MNSWQKALGALAASTVMLTGATTVPASAAPATFDVYGSRFEDNESGGQYLYDQLLLDDAPLGRAAKWLSENCGLTVKQRVEGLRTAYPEPGISRTSGCTSDPTGIVGIDRVS